MRKKNKTVLLIDGDVLAFRGAAAVEKRSILVHHLPTGKSKEFSTRTEFRNVLKNKGWEDREKEYTITDQQNAEHISHCLRNIKARVRLLQEETGADDVEIYISGSKNFRLDLPLPTRYKSNRDDTIRPLHLQAAKDYLVQKFGAIKSWEQEADDILSIRAYSLLDEGNTPIICSIDKDTFQAEGVGIYDWTKENPEVFFVPKEGVGELIENGTKVTGYGLKFLALQLLFGDPVDGYKPSEVLGVRYGIKSAYKALKDLSTSEEVLSAVVQQYKAWYPEPFEYTSWDGKTSTKTWEDMLDLYFKCAWMKRTDDDPSDWRIEFKRRSYV